MGKLGRTVCIAAMLFACSATGAAAGTSPAAAKSPELDRLVGDVCAKPVVLLGEDASHASARTLELKVELVQRLVEECGFSAVFFESQIYDFLDLARAFEAKTATPERLADAIGGLWSTTREIDPLIAFLYQRGAAGKVALGGLDPRLGEATALYAQRRLPAELASALREPRRGECAASIARNATWQYDDAHPYGPAAEAELAACAREIRAATAQGKSAASRSEAEWVSANFSRYREINADGGANAWERRDRAMFENFEWLRARLPKPAKVIVWCATVHAAKRLPADSRRRNPLGSYIHQALGDQAAAIGFTALSGRVGQMGKPPLELATASDSLEQRTLAGSQDELRYLDRKQLAALGAVPAHPLDYSRAQTADWSGVLDGLIVLREERPLERVRPPKPQQVH